jgi:hypothetical protein
MTKRRRSKLFSTELDMIKWIADQAVHNWKLIRTGAIDNVHHCIVEKEYNDNFQAIGTERIGVVKSCAYCGMNFEAVNKCKQYCSIKCRESYHNEAKKHNKRV